jgi:hypothetical protein
MPHATPSLNSTSSTPLFNINVPKTIVKGIKKIGKLDGIGEKKET